MRFGVGAEYGAGCSWPEVDHRLRRCHQFAALTIRPDGANMDAQWIAAIAAAVGVPITVLAILQVTVSAAVQSRSASKNATLNYVIREITDTDLMNIRMNVDKVASESVGKSSRDMPADLNDRNSIETLLKYYEATAIALLDRTIDEKTYRKGAEPEWRFFHARLRPFIASLRKKEPSAFSHFEAVAKRWHIE
jgi:hypothetical protein